MPSAPSKSSMSLREIVACEDFLDGHREYAIDLLSSIEEIHRYHPTDTCAKTRQGRPCTLCEIGKGATGLAGAANKVLKCYKDADNHLKTACALLGRRATVRGSPRQETLFKSDLAKTIFLCVARVGDDLRSQHATWLARLESDMETSGGSNKDISMIAEIPAYSGPKFVAPESHPKPVGVPTQSVPGTSSSSSTFLVLRRCLSSDCPCGANATSNPVLRGVPESHRMADVPISCSKTKKVRASKGMTTLEVTARRTSVTFDSLANARTDVHTIDGTPGLANVPVREHDTSHPTSKTASLTPDTVKSSSSECDVSMIVDPRVFRYREQIVRSDEARRALMIWCRAWTVDLGLRPQEETLGTGSGSEPLLLAQESMVGTDGVELLDSDTPPYMVTSSGREVATQCQSGDDDDMFKLKQETLKEQWVMARQKCRRVNRKKSVRLV